MNNIFVYGTLMSPYGNHRLISRNNKSRFLADTITQESYWFSISGIPFMVKTKTLVSLKDYNKKAQVHGEIWSVSNEVLSDLDCLEGHPFMYRREPIKIKWFSGFVEGYFYQHKVNASEPNDEGKHRYGRI